MVVLRKIPADTWKDVLEWRGITNIGISCQIYALNLTDQGLAASMNSRFLDVGVQITVWSLRRFTNELLLEMVFTFGISRTIHLILVSIFHIQ